MLFVVDSVTRQWLERAKQAGQDPFAAAAPDGTYASGVQRMTDILPVLAEDTIKLAPQTADVRRTL